MKTTVAALQELQLLQAQELDAPTTKTQEALSLALYVHSESILHDLQLLARISAQLRCFGEEATR